MGEFDKALGVYERIVAEDDTDAEAHWCCALCRYGIEYVEDPVSYEWLPTCHRASFDSFLEDVDYLAALEHSDGITRRQYQKDAAKIAEVQHGILATSQNTEPYDVFISYKELDANGERTRDSILAQDIYYQLTEKGWRVFFSRISLEDIPGTQYEPYIFAALNSAKVMIVVGTSPENLNAVWVKNEWSRFLAMMRKDKSKLLIPCYRDMDAYDLPEQLAVLMSYDMGRIGFIQDLIRGVSKVLYAEKQKEAPQKKETVVIQQSGGGPNVQALLDRGNMALEDEEWENAADFFNRALDMDAKCGEAYLGMFLVENQCRNAEEYAAAQIEKLSECQFETLTACEAQTERVRKAVEDNAVPGYLTAEELTELFDFDLSYSGSLHGREEQLRETERFFAENRLLNRAKQYASPETAAKLKKIESTVYTFLKDAAEEARAEEENCMEVAEEEAARMGQEARSKREADYKEACRAFEQASGSYDYMKLSDLLERLNGYKNSEEIKKRCEDALQRLKEQEEKKAKEKKKKFFTAAGITAVLALAVFMLVTKVIIPPIRYNEATERLSIGEYPEAAMLFYQAGDYENSKERYLETAQKAGMYRTISAGFFHTVGLKADGTVVAEGEKNYGQCNVSNWTDIVAISAGSSHTVGLKSNGTVVAVGCNGDGRCNVSYWTNIVAVSAGGSHTVGLKSDGTVVAVGDNDDGECNVRGWRDIVAVSAGCGHTVGLKADGTVVAVGSNWIGQCNVSGWTDIVAVSAGAWHTVGLKADGTVMAVGRDYYGQCNVSDWTDIVAVSAGKFHTVGLKSDGTVVAVGDNDDGQCNVSDWTDIKLPGA